MSLKDKDKLKKHGGNARHLARSLGIEAIDLIDFSSNINPYGPPLEIINAIKNTLDSIGEYPEQEAETFAAEVAAKFGISPENVVVGNGTIELIYLIPRALNAKKALLPVPSFTEYELSLINAGAKVFYNSALSADRLVETISNTMAGVDIVIIGNPNNPCGYKIEKDDLLNAVDSNPNTTWVIDEAFIDFVPDGMDTTLIHEASRRNNLIVLRSLTKIYSIAGLRLGYLVTGPETAHRIREEKYPWSINSLAIAAGKAALNDEGFVADSVTKLAGEAQRFYVGLSGIDDLTPFKPAANYILVRIEAQITSPDLQKALLTRGYVIRDCSSYTGMDNKYFRVAVKRPDDNDKLLDALRSRGTLLRGETVW
ncbi:MAG: threonine-phosphate decarboxylase [Candidatus Aquicultor secundus]|uniref:threonine-phosphate decarboxylase n=1 Tax=Candidatus Aquicultor secundus TaxID=1973895 RepID=A0A2M7TBA9_9ACTN|nr:threonine-phosphate decarboxylase CobD [Candidatus Aquicultor secundus]NCO66747.1 threonine-phosphate decarboxylase [Solirubrobacter sp.]OIO83782.1 MAG: threonine-phosphate decarboxylase [Candidatus Aquicultor secundus]PIU27921.1 MAG: threonine-phosphate decarboxylase [Candidatus Aquicultor secundus]PIW21746.1 MAG: threonine-phosphate decarboxylase [Candidatus Aquicultor secundus]PIX51807.1 MAG: threonine-phosphate decarboxylase [Candidatus Aquicultor secundus]